MGFELIKVGDDLYTVERKIPEHKGVNVDVFKASTNSTNVNCGPAPSPKPH